MRRPPRAGPSTELWMAMIALRPASLLWQKTTSSWPVCGEGFENHGGTPGLGARLQASETASESS